MGEAKQMWIRVKEYLCSLFKINFQLSPAMCLLGCQIEGVELSKELQYLLGLAFLSVKRLILLNWKVRKPNCFDMNIWMRDFLDLASMEQAATTLQEIDCTPMNPLRQILSLLNPS